MIHLIFQTIFDAGMVLGILAFFCFIFILCGVFIKVTGDVVSWLFR